MVAAHLLKQETPEVFAIHFRTGFETEPSDRILRRIQSIGEQLGIPVHLIDLSADFKRQVVDYFATTYLSGETPNPCVVCNPLIKFGALLRVSEGLGADVLATGHYARVRMDYSSGRYRLFKGLDSRKDQSYFLARLTQTQLARACFPLGALTKTAVKEIAAREGLNPTNAEESQDVCFIKAGSYRQLVASLTGRTPAPGLIETTAGKVVGRPPGSACFHDRPAPRHQLPGNRTLLCRAPRHRTQPPGGRAQKRLVGRGVPSGSHQLGRPTARCSLAGPDAGALPDAGSLLHPDPHGG